MLVDEAETIELARGQASDPLGHLVIHRGARMTLGIRPIVQIFQCDPHRVKHHATPEQRVWLCPYSILSGFARISADFRQIAYNLLNPV